MHFKKPCTTILFANIIKPDFVEAAKAAAANGGIKLKKTELNKLTHYTPKAFMPLLIDERWSSSPQYLYICYLF